MLRPSLSHGSHMAVTNNSMAMVAAAVWQYFAVAEDVIFLFRLLPGVEDVAQNVADPECRSVASKAHATLLKVGADGKVTGIVANEAEVLAVLGSAIAKQNCTVGEVVVKYIASMMCGLINASQYKDDQWIEVGHHLWC